MPRRYRDDAGARAMGQQLYDCFEAVFFSGIWKIGIL